MAQIAAQRAWKATLVNAALVTIAFVAPRAAGTRESGFAGAAGAALFFAAPMAAALVIGVIALAGTYRMAKREGKSMPWAGVAPLGVFCLAVLALIALVAAQSG